MLKKLSMTVKKAKTTQYYNMLAGENLECFVGFGNEKWNGMTYGQPLRVVLLVVGEESSEGVVSGDDEASEVGEELATEVEDDEEEVKSTNTDDGIGLGNAGLSLQVVKRGILGQLSLRVRVADAGIESIEQCRLTSLSRVLR